MLWLWLWLWLWEACRMVLSAQIARNEPVDEGSVIGRLPVRV